MAGIENNSNVVGESGLWSLTESAIAGFLVRSLFFPAVPILMQSRNSEEHTSVHIHMTTFNPYSILGRDPTNHVINRTLSYRSPSSTPTMGLRQPQVAGFPTEDVKVRVWES